LFFVLGGTFGLFFHGEDIVTADFPKETKCIPICMPGSSFMHILTYKWIQKQYHIRKRKIIRDLRFILEMKAPNITGSRLGLRTPSSSNILKAASSFWATLFIARVSTCRTKQVWGKTWIQRLYSGLGYKHLSNFSWSSFISTWLLIKYKFIPTHNCRMDLPGPTTSVGTRTDYSVGPWDYPSCATRYLKAWSTRTAEEKYSVRKLYMSCTVWKTPRRTRLVLSPYSDL
jgi:hypothetical protein